MYCSKCGAVVVGKYFSCCGNRIRSELEELRLAERRAEKAFIHDFTHNAEGSWLASVNSHLVHACWLASFEKYSKGGTLYKVGDSVPAEAFESLRTVRDHAERLYLAMLSF